MNARTTLIDGLANDISCGHAAGRYDAAFFLDSLIDAGRVSAVDVAVLLTCDQLSDKHIDTSDRLRLMLQKEAIEFFTTHDDGILYIDDKLAEDERDSAVDRAYAEQVAA